MEGQTITIPTEKYEELIEAKASIHALQCYVKAERYPDRQVMCNIIGVAYKEED